MDTFLPGLVMGFREGLEAFLLVVIILQFLKKSKAEYLRRNVFSGVVTGIIASFAVGWLLFAVSNKTEQIEKAAKLSESGGSFLALALVTTFIYWMIKHGHKMVETVENQAKNNLSALGIASVAFIMVAREGIEIALFTFAGKYSFLSIATGISAALILTLLIYFSLVNVNLKVIFSVTLAYLIIQAGFLLGYGVHEGLSALKDMQILSKDSVLFLKAFDISNTIFNHKEGVIGLPLYVLLGWYSKPEIIQFLLQYSYTFGLFYIWYKTLKLRGKGVRIVRGYDPGTIPRTEESWSSMTPEIADEKKALEQVLNNAFFSGWIYANYIETT